MPAKAFDQRSPCRMENAAKPESFRLYGVLMVLAAILPRIQCRHSFQLRLLLIKKIALLNGKRKVVAMLERLKDALHMVRDTPYPNPPPNSISPKSELFASISVILGGVHHGKE